MHILFKQKLATRRNIEIPDFRMKIAMYLTKCRNNEIEYCISPLESLLRKSRHEFKKKCRENLGVCDDFAKYIMKKIPND